MKGIPLFKIISQCGVLKVTEVHHHLHQYLYAYKTIPIYIIDGVVSSVLFLYGFSSFNRSCDVWCCYKLVN